MSEDELRERIARAINRESYLDDEENMPDDPHPGCYEFAQAVIDDLGLTVEKISGHDPKECGCDLSEWPTESRVVGRWEEA